MDIAHALHIQCNARYKKVNLKFPTLLICHLSESYAVTLSSGLLSFQQVQLRTGFVIANYNDDSS